MASPPKPTETYKAAATAYAELWRQSNAPAPSSGPPPPLPPAAQAKAAATDELKSMPLPAFQRMVGDDAFIPPERLRFLKRIGAGSFATGECGVWGRFGVACPQWCVSVCVFSQHARGWEGCPRGD